MSNRQIWPTVALVATDRVLNADMLEAGAGVGVSGFLQRLEETGTGRPDSTVGPVVSKNPTPSWKWRQKWK